jgi:hypothetical protein
MAITLEYDRFRQEDYDWTNRPSSKLHSPMDSNTSTLPKCTRRKGNTLLGKVRMSLGAAELDINSDPP